MRQIELQLATDRLGIMKVRQPISGVAVAAKIPELPKFERFARPE